MFSPVNGNYVRCSETSHYGTEVRLSGAAAAAVALFAAVMIGIAVWFFKFRKPGNSDKGKADLDDYDEDEAELKPENELEAPGEETEREDTVPQCLNLRLIAEILKRSNFPRTYYCSCARLLAAVFNGSDVPRRAPFPCLNFLRHSLCLPCGFYRQPKSLKIIKFNFTLHLTHHPYTFYISYPHDGMSTHIIILC